MLKICCTAALLAITGVAFAQTSTAPGTPPSTLPSTTPGTPPSTSPSVTPSESPVVTPSQTPYVTPSQTPAVSPSQTPAITSSPSATIPGPVTPRSAVGGLSKCENMIGADKDSCLQQERAGTGSTGSMR